MSIHVMNLVWGSTLEGSSRRFVLLALADRADDEGYCWPAIQNVAQKTGLSESTVKRVLTSLEDAGLVWRQERWTDRGDRDTNSYWINLEALESDQRPREITRGRHPMANQGQRQGGGSTTNGGWVHGEPTGGSMVTPNTSVEPPSDPSEASARGAASQLRCDGPKDPPEDPQRSYPSSWDDEDAAAVAHEVSIDRLVSKLEAEPDIVWLESYEETMARSMLDRGEPYPKVLNTIRKDRRAYASP